VLPSWEYEPGHRGSPPNVLSLALRGIDPSDILHRFRRVCALEHQVGVVLQPGKPLPDCRRMAGDSWAVTPTWQSTIVRAVRMPAQCGTSSSTQPTCTGSRLMPHRPLHPCASPGCRELVARRFCEAHAKRATQDLDARRGTATDRGYNATWSRARSMKLSNTPLCERCEAQGLVVRAVLVHHKDRNPRNNQASNHESLCSACHDAEHANERWVGR
jgi:5-methylcytosine-specific restriction protein A